jgi:hypothetical protein
MTRKVAAALVVGLLVGLLIGMLLPAQAGRATPLTGDRSSSAWPVWSAGHSTSLWTAISRRSTSGPPAAPRATQRSGTA